MKSGKMTYFGRLVCSVFYLGFCVHIAEARLGETPEECENRYGKPVSHPTGDHQRFDFARWVHYEKNDFHFVIGFMNGRASCIEIRKKGDLRFDSKEVAAALAANRGKSEWILSVKCDTSQDHYWQIWNRKDGAATASEMPECLMISTEEYGQAAQARNAEEKKKELSTF